MTRKDRAISYTERTTTMKQCRKLTKFIRLVQYLFTTSVTDVLRNSAQRFLELMVECKNNSDDDELAVMVRGKCSTTSNRKPIFIVEYFFESVDIVFRPASWKFRNYLEHCFAEGAKMFSACASLLTTDDLFPFAKVAPSDSLGLEPSDAFAINQLIIFTNDLLLKKNIADIGQQLLQTFGDIWHFSQNYKGFEELFVPDDALVSCISF